jgi:hypothetical protein
LIEKYPCEDKDELNGREQYWIDKNKKICVNKNKSYVEDKEGYKKECYENNKEEINKKLNCKCGGKYTQRTKSRHEKTKKHQLFIKLNPIV